MQTTKETVGFLERVPLFKLAWDAAISAFAGRQVLYERFFFGDPVRMAGALVAAHDAEIRGYAERVRELVRSARDEAFASATAPGVALPRASMPAPEK